MYVKNVKELKIYQIALQLTGEITKLIKQIGLMVKSGVVF